MGFVVESKLMTKKSEKSNYMVVCADWEFICRCKSPEDAASIALIKNFEKLGESLNLSPTVSVFDISSAYETMNVVDNIHFFYTPHVLADSGYHELSKKYINVINLLNNESKDS